MLQIRILPVTISKTTFQSTFSVTFSKNQSDTDVRKHTAATVFWLGTGQPNIHTVEIEQTDRGSYGNGFHMVNGVLTALTGDNLHVWGEIDTYPTSTAFKAPENDNTTTLSWTKSNNKLSATVSYTAQTGRALVPKQVTQNSVSITSTTMSLDVLKSDGTAGYSAKGATTASIALGNCEFVLPVYHRNPPSGRVDVNLTSDVSNSEITVSSAHNFATGDALLLHGKDIPTQFAAEWPTVVFVIKLTDTKFKIATSRANANNNTAIDILPSTVDVNFKNVTQAQLFPTHVAKAPKANANLVASGVRIDHADSRYRDRLETKFYINQMTDKSLVLLPVKVDTETLNFFVWNTVSAKWVQQNSSFQSRILPQAWTATESGRLHAITFAEPTYGGNGGIDVKIEVS